LVNDPSTVRRPSGSCGFGVPKRLTWFGPGPRSVPPAVWSWAISIARKMNRRPAASSTNAALTGAPYVCIVGLNAGQTPESHVARTVAGAHALGAPRFLGE